jgi:uncharacterized delta-60 repeat protein
MVNKRLDSRQSICRDALDQIASSAGQQVDNVLIAINSELTMPLRMVASTPSDLVINIGNILLTNPEISRNRTLPHIHQSVVAFTSGKVTLPATTGGNITFSTIGSTSVVLTCPSGQYVKVLIYLDSAGNLGAVVGSTAGTEAGALVPKFARRTFSIGYISVYNNGGTVDNITNSKIYQFTSNSTSDLDLENEFAIANNQVAPANITDFILDPTIGENTKVDHSIVRKHLDPIAITYDNTVRKILFDGDNKIVVGGDFTQYNGVACPARLSRLTTYGTLDTTFNTGGAGFNSAVHTIAIDGSGNIVVGGEFTQYNGSAAPNFLCRLLPDGTLDTTFNTGGAGFNNHQVHTIAIDDSGNIVVVGEFTQYNGVACPARLCRLLPDGTLDTTFNTGGAGFNSRVRAIAIDGSGNFLVGGHFTTYNGSACPNFLCRLLPDGTLDTTFNTGGAGFNSAVHTIAIDGSGNIVVGGTFTTYNGSVCPARLCRLLPDGTLDTTFNTDGAGFNNVVYSIAIDGSGNILVGGAFAIYNGSACPVRLCRLLPDGTLDTTFNTGGAGFNNQVHTIAIDGSGNIVVGGGNFVTYNGVACTSYFCRVTSDGTTVSPFNAVYYYKEIGRFYTQYDDDTAVWSITGETFTGSNAGVTFSMSGNQLQYISTNIAGTPNKSYFRYIVKYL